MRAPSLKETENYKGNIANVFVDVTIWVCCLIKEKFIIRFGSPARSDTGVHMHKILLIIY